MSRCTTRQANRRKYDACLECPYDISRFGICKNGYENSYCRKSKNNHCCQCQSEIKSWGVPSRNTALSQKPREMHFYEASFWNGYPFVVEVAYPECPSGFIDHFVFLVYAESERKASNLAYAHFIGEKPLKKFYGKYGREEYHGDVMCVME